MCHSASLSSCQSNGAICPHLRSSWRTQRAQWVTVWWAAHDTWWQSGPRPAGSVGCEPAAWSWDTPGNPPQRGPQNSSPATANNKHSIAYLPLNILRMRWNGGCFVDDIYGLVQERRNSSALAMELRLSCTNPLTYSNISVFLRVQLSLLVLVMAWCKQHDKPLSEPKMMTHRTSKIRQESIKVAQFGQMWMKICTKYSYESRCRFFPLISFYCSPFISLTYLWVE